MNFVLLCVLFFNVILFIPCGCKSEEGRKNYSAHEKGRECIENVCEDALDYPYERIKEIEHQLLSYQALFGYVDGSTVAVNSRYSSRPATEEAEPLCRSITHNSFPKTLKNKGNVEKYIVNVESHTQGLIFETCVQNTTCLFFDVFPSGYTSKCVQKYATRRMLVVDDHGNVTFDDLVVPSCCVCMIAKL